MNRLYINKDKTLKSQTDLWIGVTGHGLNWKRRLKALYSYELRQLAEKLTGKNCAGTGQSQLLQNPKKKLRNEMPLHAIKCTAANRFMHMDQSTDAETP